MEIKVFEINKQGKDEILIRFSSPYGSAHGYWMDQNPEINKSYHVEFDIPQVLVWGKDIKEAESDEYSVGYDENGNIFIRSMFHSYDESGCLTVRLGESLVLVETKGDPIANCKFLRICFSKMNIYPHTL